MQNPLHAHLKSNGKAVEVLPTDRVGIYWMKFEERLMTIHEDDLIFPEEEQGIPVSDCCNATIIYDGFCSECKEHCDIEYI